MIPDRLWIYRARALHVVDGDTLDIELDQGLHAYRMERLRLLGVNTPELKGATREAGLAAKGYVAAWLEAAHVDPANEWPLVLQTARGDAFGRYLAYVWRVSDGSCLNDALLYAGHAVVFRPEPEGGTT